MTLGDFALNVRESRQILYGMDWRKKKTNLLVSLSAVSNNASLVFHTLSGLTKDGWYNMADGRMQHERLIDVKY